MLLNFSAFTMMAPSKRAVNPTFEESEKSDYHLLVEALVRVDQSPSFPLTAPCYCRSVAPEKKKVYVGG